MGTSGRLGQLRAKVAGSLRHRAGRRGGGGAAVSAEAQAPPGIEIAYAPEHDGDADPGEVVWGWVPYEDDPSQGKDRPVLVVGTAGSLLVAVPLSSRSHADRQDAHEWIPVGRGGWDRAGRESYADAARLLRLDPRQVRREGAALDEDRFRAVLERVRSLHGLDG